MPRNPYANMCSACDHPLSRHTLKDPDGDWVAGPYKCKHCDCEVRQDAPSYGMTRVQFERHMGPLA